jgi:hypothetical protein
VLAAQLTQTPPPPFQSDADAIIVPAPEPAPAPPPPPFIAAEGEEAAAAPAGPQLAQSGSHSATLSVMAAMLLGVGTAVVNVGRRRMDVELDNRAFDAMARIRAAAAPLD